MKACFCIGPQPGQTLCPCRLRNESDKDRRIRILEEEIETLRRRRERESALDFPRRSTAEDDLLTITKRLQARNLIGP